MSCAIKIITSISCAMQLTMQRNAEQIKYRYDDTGTFSGTYLTHIFVNIMDGQECTIIRHNNE